MSSGYDSPPSLLDVSELSSQLDSNLDSSNLSDADDDDGEMEMFAQESYDQQQQPASSSASLPVLDVSKLSHLTERQQLAFLMRATQMRDSPPHGSPQPSAPRAKAAAPAAPPSSSSSRDRQQQRSAKPSMMSDDKKRRSSAAAVSSARRHSAAVDERDGDGVVYTVHKLPPAASSPLPLPRPAAYSSWSAAQQRRWNSLRADPNAFYYHHTLAPAPSSSPFSESEHRLFLHLLLRHPPRGQWGLFALNLPGRTGRQCELYEAELRSSGALPSSYHFDYRAWYEDGRKMREKQPADSQTPAAAAAAAAAPAAVMVVGRKRLQAAAVAKREEANAADSVKTEQTAAVSPSVQSEAAQASPAAPREAVAAAATAAGEERRKVKTVRFRESERQEASTAATPPPPPPAPPSDSAVTVDVKEPRLHPIARAARRLPPQLSAADSAASPASSLPPLWIPTPPVLPKPEAISSLCPPPSSALPVPAAALSSLSPLELAFCRAQAQYEVRLRRLQSYAQAEESRAERARKRGRGDSRLSSSSGCTALYGGLEANAGRLRAAYYAEYEDREEMEAAGGDEAMMKRLRSVRQCVAEMRHDVHREYVMEIEMLRSRQGKQ